MSYTNLSPEELTRENLIKDNDFISDAESFLAARQNELYESPEEVYDAYMNHMRQHEVNEITAVRDLNYAQDADTQEKERFGRLLNTFDRMEGDSFFSAEGLDKFADYAEGIITAPSTYAGLISGGTGKVAGVAAGQAAKLGVRAVLGKALRNSALRSGVTEGAIATGASLAKQGARVESGVKEEVSTTEALVEGALTGAVAAVPGSVFGAIKGKQAETAVARGQAGEGIEKQKALFAKQETEKFFKQLDNPKLEKEFKDKIIGDVKQVRDLLKNKNLIRSSKLDPLDPEKVAEGNKLMKDLSGADRLLATLDDQTLDAVTAAAIKVSDKIKLRKNERITSGIQRALSEGDLDVPEIENILKTHDLTMEQFSYVYMAEASNAGRVLQRASKLKKLDAKRSLESLSSAANDLLERTGTGLAEDEVKSIANAARKELGFKRSLQALDRFRLSAMTSQIATTVRNTAGGSLRVAMDVTEQMSENIIRGGVAGFKAATGDIAGAKEAASQLVNPLNIAKYALFDQAEATIIRQAFSRNMPAESQKLFGTFLEGADLSAKLGHQGALTKMGAGLNVLNRASDNMIKNAVFAGELSNQVMKSGKFLKADGSKMNLIEVIEAGRFNEVSADMIKSATDKSFEFTFQKYPTGKGVASKIGRGVLRAHREAPFVVSALFAMPFPRYTINAISFAAQRTPVLGVLAARKGGQAQTSEILAKQASGLYLMGAFYGARSMTPDNYEWFEYRGEDGETYNMQAMLGPFAPFALGADLLYRYNNDLPMSKPFSGAGKDAIQATLGSGFRSGTGLYTLDLLADDLGKMMDEGGDPSIQGEKIAARFLGDTANTFTLPAAVARDLYATVDADARIVPESGFSSFLDTFTARATRSLPAPVREALVTRDRESYDLFTGDVRRMVDPLERQLFGVSKREEKTAIQSEISRLRLSPYDLYKPAQFPFEDELIRKDAGEQIARKLNFLVRDPDYRALKSDEEKRKALVAGAQQFIKEGRDLVREKIIKLSSSDPEAKLYYKSQYEQLDRRLKNAIDEYYKRQKAKEGIEVDGIGDNYTEGLLLAPEVRDMLTPEGLPSAPKMAEGGLVDDQMDALSLSETAEEQNKDVQEEQGEEFVETAVRTAAEIAPVSGEILSAKDAYESYKRGDYVGTALGVVGAIPGIGMVARGAKAGIKALRSVDTVEDKAEALKLLDDDAAVDAWKKANKLPESQRQKRNPVVQQAAKDLSEGNITGKEYRATVKGEMPIKLITSDNFPEMPTTKEIVGALTKDKAQKGVVGLNLEIADGTRVGSRLDIPAYDEYDTWVVSLHDGTKQGGKALGYGQSAVLNNVEFFTSAKGAQKIAEGSANKSTIARIHGDYENRDPQQVYEDAFSLLDDPEWTQVGMNPFRHSFFYDKATGNPVTRADQVLQVGPLVLAKGARSELSDLKKLKIKSKDGKVRVFNEGGLMSPRK